MDGRPNIVIIMTDQQQARLCAREGYPIDTMPFVDNLAKDGIWFSRAYAPNPTCVPARISMLTGRYPNATRVKANGFLNFATFEKDLFQVFKEQGYFTALVGKNHSHLTKDMTDFFYGSGHISAEDDNSNDENLNFHRFFTDNIGHHFSPDPTPHPVHVQFPYRCVDKATNWIKSNKNTKNPFLLWLSFAEPHNPYQVPEPYYSMFPPQELPPVLANESVLNKKSYLFQRARRWQEKAFPILNQIIPRVRSNYMGMLRLIDDQIKRFTEFLEKEKLRENTVIIFVSDHGDFVGEYGLIRKGIELPEFLTRIPFVVNGPGISPLGHHQAHVSLVDIFPTLCDMIGVNIPEGIQGKSLWPLLNGKDYPENEFNSAYAELGYGGLYVIYKGAIKDKPMSRMYSKDGVRRGSYNGANSWTQSGTMRMVRKGDWKLIFDMMGQGQLYNLVNDPAELNNVYGKENYAKIQQKLITELLTWVLRAQDPIPLPEKKYNYNQHPNNFWTPHYNDLENPPIDF